MWVVARTDSCSRARMIEPMHKERHERRRGERADGGRSIPR